MTKWIMPCTLEGRTAVLVPLTPGHATDLGEAVEDGQLYKIWYENIPRPAEMNAEIARRLTLQAQGNLLAFVVRQRATNRIVGTTSFLNIDPQNKRLGIGGTWYASSSQRTGLNDECKLLLLHHAFEALDCIAVEFQIHTPNRPARRAVERLGAHLDGTMRSRSFARNGAVLDSAIYSVTAAEWPAVCSNLEWLLRNDA